MIKQPSIFLSGDLPLDRCHIKSIMPFSNINQELFHKYYSPSAVSLELIMDCAKILEGLYGKNLLEKDNARIFFPKDTCDPILVLYDVPVWEDGDWESKETARHSLVIAIAPRALLRDDKVTDFPKLSELEVSNDKTQKESTK